MGSADLGPRSRARRLRVDQITAVQHPLERARRQRGGDHRAGGHRPQVAAVGADVRRRRSVSAAPMTITAWCAMVSVASLRTSAANQRSSSARSISPPVERTAASSVSNGASSADGRSCLPRPAGRRGEASPRTHHLWLGSTGRRFGLRRRHETRSLPPSRPRSAAANRSSATASIVKASASRRCCATVSTSRARAGRSGRTGQRRNDAGGAAMAWTAIISVDGHVKASRAWAIATTSSASTSRRTTRR